MRGLAALAGCLAALGCTNNPYPDTDRDKKVIYSSFPEAPKTLDPAVAYTTAEHVITGNVYDTLLEYDYLARPYRLIAGLAAAVPEPRELSEGRQAYRFQIRPGILFHADPCFAPDEAGRPTREAVAADFAFALARIADPAVNSPVIGSFAQIQGFADFSKRLAELRNSDQAFVALPAHEQYARAGGIAGVVVLGSHELEIVLTEPNAQILYWFAMPFTTPLAWEAVAYYTGKDGRASFSDHAVGTGPFQLSLYEKQYRFTLERNELWYGQNPANAGAPGTVFPSQIDAQDVAEGRIDPAYSGRRLPFIDRVKFYREREGIPQFNKFLQGYYDDGGIIKESFDSVIEAGRLSPPMQARGMRLDKTVEPSIFYVGFNMEDPVLGTAAGERGRKLRQAMSLAIDSRQYLELFLNGRGMPAQTLLPPGLFGYDASLQEPLPPVRPRSRAADPCRGRLPQRHRSGYRQPPPAELRHVGHHRGRQPAVRVPCGCLAPDRPRHPDQRHHLQSIPGQGAPRRLPDLQLGLACRFPRPREFPFPAGVRERALQERRAEHGRLLQRGVRQALRPDEVPAQQRAPRRCHPAHAGDPGAGAPLDRALPPGRFRAEPRLAGQLQAHGHLLSGLQVQGRAARGEGATADAMERTRALAAVSRAVRRRRPNRARRADLLSGAPVMAAYLVRRIGYGFVTMLGVLLLLFVLFFAVTDPDDIARKAVGERARPEVYAQWKKNHGYDKPLFLNTQASGTARYTDTLLFEHYRRMLTFDFGRSDADDSPISRRLRDGSGPSLSLTVPLFVLGLLVSVAVALFVAFFRETYVDRLMLVACMLTMSIASLLYIIAGQFLVGQLLRWFPISGFDPNPAVVARFLALPVLVGVVSGFGADTRLYRTIFLEEIGRDYVRTARAKGCGDGRVMVRHVLRNALIPILTNIVIQIPFLFTGALLLESFFGIPGLGALTVEAIQGNDFSTLRTMVYLGALLFILGQILTDISYALADPRVRLG